MSEKIIAFLFHSFTQIFRYSFGFITFIPASSKSFTLDVKIYSIPLFFAIVYCRQSSKSFHLFLNASSMSLDVAERTVTSLKIFSILENLSESCYSYITISTFKYNIQQDICVNVYHNAPASSHPDNRSVTSQYLKYIQSTQSKHPP